MRARFAVTSLLALALGACATSSRRAEAEPAATPAAEPVKTAAVNGATLAYVEAGSGDPLVLVHGGLQDHRMWAPLLETLSRRHRVIAYSRRNHFPNAVSLDGAPDNAADIHGDDVAALISALGLTRAHVVGHSSGAHAALFLAANHPQLVRSLVLNEPPAAGLLLVAPGGDEVLKEFATRFAPAWEAFRTGELASAMRLFADAVGGPGTYDRRPESVRRMMMDNAAAHQAESRSARRATFTCDMAARITAPTLLTNGERSPPFFHRITEQLERCLPNEERVIVPGASHTVPGEQPDAFARAVLAFLAKQP